MNSKQLATTVLLSLVALGGRAWAINQAPHDAAHNVTCQSCHIPFGGLADAAHQASGGASAAGTTTSLTDGTQTWTANAWVGALVTFNSGSLPTSLDGGTTTNSNNGQFRTITANTTTTLTWAEPLPFAVASGDTFSLNLATYDDIEVKCKSCHNPAGSASAHPAGGLHNTGAHSQAIGCGKCHEPHNIDANSGWSGDGAGGGNLIRTDIRRPDGSKGTIVYTPGVLTQTAGNGVCQTCHTKTPYYRNDGSLQTHHVGENCVSCHSHEVQFFVDLGTTSDLDTGDHYDSNSQAYTDHTASGACVRCHTNDGFKDYIGASGAAMNYNDTFLAKGTVFPAGPMNCQTCHNSVSDPTVASAGLTSVEFVSLNTITGLDKATGLCSQCHQGRESTASVNSKISGAVATASKGLAIISVTASAAGTTTTIQAKTAMAASQYKGYTLVATNNANQGLKVTVADNTVGTTSAAGTITLASTLTAATNGPVTGPPAIPADTFTLWPTATGGGSDAFTGIRQGDQAVRRGTTLVDSSRAWNPNQWTNFYLFIQTDPNPGSPNAGLYRLITGNDATSLTVANAALSSGMAFPAPIAAGTRYEILVKEDTSVLDAVASSISFSNSHYLPASAILHGADAMIGYQNPRNLANAAVVQTNTSTSTSTATALGTGTQTGTVTVTSTATNTNIITPNVAAARSYAGKNLHGVSQDSCVSCHSPHTLEVAVSDTTCGRCHFKEDGTPVANMAELEEARQFGFDGDIDGDGTAESLKAEVDGLATLLYSAIQRYATVKAGHGICYLASTNPYWFIDTNGSGGFCDTAEADPCNVYSSVTGTTLDANSVACVAGKQHTGYYTPRLLRAAFNYQIYVKEPGAWAHNPRYIIEMLYDSLVDLDIGLPIANQVGFLCATVDSNKQIIWNDPTKPVTSDDGVCSGKTRVFAPRRSFAFGSHFDGMKNAFRRWDTNTGNAAPGLAIYPCMRCHGGQAGLEQYLSTATWYNQTQASAGPVVPSQGMQCTTCHAPQATDTDMKRMRDMEATAIGGVRFPGHWAGGTLGAPGSAGGPAQVILGSSFFATKSDMICATCHNGRDISGKGVDSYLAGTWSGIDVPGRPFAGTANLVNNGGNLRITGLPLYVAAVPPYAAPNNWVYDTTKTGAAACLATSKYITISNSTNYNGTYLITGCGGGDGTVDVAKAYVIDESGVSWTSWAASTKNNHDIQVAGVAFGSDGHIGYEYTGQTYAGRKLHHGATASCTECHSPKGSRHSFEVAESVAAGICKNCHSGTAYTTWVAPSRTLTTATLGTELQLYVNALGAALNQYTRTAGVTPAAGNFCLNSSNSVKAEVSNSTGLCPTGSGTWGGGYDPKMARAMFNLTMCTATDPAAWAHNYNYCAELLYDSSIDLGLTPAGLTRP